MGWKPLGTVRDGVQFSDAELTSDETTWSDLPLRPLTPSRTWRAEFSGHDLAALMAAHDDATRAVQIDVRFRYPGGHRGTTRGD